MPSGFIVLLVEISSRGESLLLRICHHLLQDVKLSITEGVKHFPRKMGPKAS